MNDIGHPLFQKNAGGSSAPVVLLDPVRVLDDNAGFKSSSLDPETGEHLGQGPAR